MTLPPTLRSGGREQIAGDVKIARYGETFRQSRKFGL